MAMFGIDGLASGLDTTSLINQLMQVEAMPQTLLKQKSTQTQDLVTALQGLNTRVASLADAAAKAAEARSWSAWRATSSDEGVTATASSSAEPGSVSFRVEQLATAQQSVSDVHVAAGTGLVLGYPPAVTIVAGDDSLVTIQPTSGSLQDIARAINEASEAGVRATVVRVGTDGDGVPQYRLQFTGTRTGKDSTFKIYAGDADAVGDPARRIDAVEVRAAADARIVLWDDNPALRAEFESSSNTFTDVMTGVDVTVSALTAADDDPVTLTVDRDDDALAKLGKDMIGAMGVVLSEITSRTATTTRTNPDGTTSVTGGIFSADSTVRAIRDQLLSAMSMPVDGRSPSEVGIVLGRDGTFTFDEERFAAAMAADPAGTQAMVAGIAQRVADVATSYSDKYDGVLTRKIQSTEGQVRDLGTQIESWDRRLELRRASLQRTYAALEVTLSNLQGQSSWLAGQLAGLSANWQK